MNRHRWVVLFAVLVLTGCSSGGPPTASGSDPAPSATVAASASPAGTPPTADVVYLALGDSNVYGAPEDCGSCTTYPHLVQKALTKSSGGSVALLDGSQHNRLTASSLLSELQADNWFDDSVHPIRFTGLTPRQAVAAADVVTITVSANDMPWYQSPDSCSNTYDEACLQQIEAPFATALDGVLAEIVTLRGGKPTAVRVTTFYNDLLEGPDYDPNDFYNAEQVAKGKTQVRTFLDTWNGDICAAAERHQALCADTYRAINGKDGLTPLGKGFFSKDAGDLNQGGQDAFAKVILDTGFAPVLAG